MLDFTSKNSISRNHVHSKFLTMKSYFKKVKIQLPLKKVKMFHFLKKSDDF